MINNETLNIVCQSENGQKMINNETLNIVCQSGNEPSNDDKQ
jgi:hypothetical protein